MAAAVSTTNAAAVGVTRIPIFRFLGGMLVLLGALVISGWWFSSLTLVRVLPQFTPMVFNTALCFALAGAVLLTIGLGEVRAGEARLAASVAVLAISSLVKFIMF